MSNSAVREKPPREEVAADDHFAVHGGVRCAGVHLIIDLYGANPTYLRDEGHIDETFRRCVDASGATLLHIHTNVFEEGGGISGVAVLAESHISIHTWPEAGFAALDVFLCGKADATPCPRILQEAFGARHMVVETILRGRGA